MALCWCEFLLLQWIGVGDGRSDEPLLRVGGSLGGLLLEHLLVDRRPLEALGDLLDRVGATCVDGSVYMRSL